MEEFVSEHGGTIVSGIVTITMFGIFLMIILAIGNMDMYEMTNIIGG